MFQIGSHFCRCAIVATGLGGVWDGVLQQAGRESGKEKERKEWRRGDKAKKQKKRVLRYKQRKRKKDGDIRKVKSKRGGEINKEKEIGVDIFPWVQLPTITLTGSNSQCPCISCFKQTNKC